MTKQSNNDIAAWLRNLAKLIEGNGLLPIEATTIEGADGIIYVALSAQLPQPSHVWWDLSGARGFFSGAEGSDRAVLAERLAEGLMTAFGLRKAEAASELLRVVQERKEEAKEEAEEALAGQGASELSTDDSDRHGGMYPKH